MKELDDIQLIKGSTTLSVEELNENINTIINSINNKKVV